MKKINVNTGRKDARFNIEKVEEKYKAKWVGQLCLKVRDGGWHGDDCGDVYYQETPPVEGYSKYFALIWQMDTCYITSGASAVEGVINAVEADDGEIIYSRFRHDFRTSKDGSVFIDGGRDYVKGGMHGRYFLIKVVDGEFYEIEPGDEDYPTKNKKIEKDIAEHDILNNKFSIRIKELEKQANLHPYYDAQQTDIEEFAKLIVAECVKIVDTWSDEVPCSEGYDILTVSKIKEHFGIE